MNTTYHLLMLLGLTVFAYLIGSIPTGYWLCRYFFNIDITAHGSGNIGATNVARVLGKRWFLVVFLIDALKAYAALALCMLISTSSFELTGGLWLYVFAAAILVGNAYSPFLSFKGGKGVATSLGIITYLLPLSVNVLAMVFWLVLLKLTHKPFIASLVSAVMVVFIYWGFFNGAHTGFLLGICLWLGFRHLPNICVWYRSTTSSDA